MLLLKPREARAVRAFREVVPQSPPLLAAETTVDRLRDRELRLGARQLVLELLGERAARSEQERLERGRRHAENARDLGVRAAFELAENDGLALLRRDLRQCRQKLADGRAVVFDLVPAMRSSSST